MPSLYRFKVDRKKGKNKDIVSICLSRSTWQLPNVIPLAVEGEVSWRDFVQAAHCPSAEKKKVGESQANNAETEMESGKRGNFFRAESETSNKVSSLTLGKGNPVQFVLGIKVLKCTSLIFLQQIGQKGACNQAPLSTAMSTRPRVFILFLMSVIWAIHILQLQAKLHSNILALLPEYYTILYNQISFIVLFAEFWWALKTWICSTLVTPFWRWKTLLRLLFSWSSLSNNSSLLDRLCSFIVESC